MRLVADVGAEPEGYQGNWIPHQMRDGVEDGVFFVGDSAGHCIPRRPRGSAPRSTSASRSGASAGSARRPPDRVAALAATARSAARTA